MGKNGLERGIFRRKMLTLCPNSTKKEQFMAEKRSGKTFDAVMRDLQARKFAPIYFLMGDEPYYIDLIADYIAENVLDESERDFNQTIVFGSDTTAAQVADMARRFPMMAEHQVVIVKEAQNLKNLEPIEKYAEKQPTNSTILVLCHKNASLDRRKKTNSSLVALIEKNGVPVREQEEGRARTADLHRRLSDDERRENRPQSRPNDGRPHRFRPQPTGFRARQGADFAAGRGANGHARDRGARNWGEQRLQCVRVESGHREPKCVQGQPDCEIF